MEYFRLMMFGLYLIQGMFYGYVYSLPLAYSNVPNYSILGLFAAAALPFSFKFIIAPLVQHYCSNMYGKRKTWINSTVLACSILMLSMAYYSQIDNLQSQTITAILLFLCILCVAIKDVAVDSLAVSTLEPGRIGLYTFLGDEIGKLVTLPLFLASISPDFGRSYGLEGSFISQRTYIQLTALFGIVFAALIHFNFDEDATTKAAARKLQRFSYIRSDNNEDINSNEASHSFSHIFDHYKKIITPAYRLCRFAAILFILNQGTEIFMESHPVELIKQKVNRQSLMLAQNLCLIPNAIISLVISRFVTSYNCLGYYFCSFIVKLISICLLHSITIESEQLSIILYGILYVVGSANYLLQNVCINQEANDAFPGISVTLLLSASNFSRLTVLQKFLIDYNGYNCCINGSLIYCLIVAMMLPQLLRWLNRGISLQLGLKLE